MKQFLKLCGNTPLVRVSDRIYAKLETYNPTGSVKDRMVSYVVDRAISKGDIVRDTILCEATSGNTGIALSSIAARLGLKCVIFMPKNMSEERKSMMTVYGAKIVNVDENDFEMAIEMRNKFLEENENAWSPMQFSNPTNIECHKMITAREIAAQLDSINKHWGVFVHGSGTGGTIEGVRQYVDENKYGDASSTKVMMVIPAESPHGIQGIGDGRDFLASPEDMDGTVIIKTDEAIERAREFCQETGILVGISSGANILAAERILEDANPTGVIVTMLCDRGERYMSIFNGETDEHTA